MTDDMFAGAFVTFYPATAAVNQGLVHIVGHLPPPRLPTRLRRPGARVGNRVLTWIIGDGSNEVVKRELSDEERKLPIAVVRNHAMLIQLISEGWTPECEGRPAADEDASGAGEPDAASAGEPENEPENEPRTILHYLYTPSREAARRLGEQLRQGGYQTQVRLGADGVNWLVLASHEAVLSEELIASTRDSMETLAASVGGEYDGWEVELERSSGEPH